MHLKSFEIKGGQTEDDGDCLYFGSGELKKKWKKKKKGTFYLFP